MDIAAWDGLPDDMLLRYDPAESMVDNHRRKRMQMLLTENAALRERLAQLEETRLHEYEYANAEAEIAATRAWLADRAEQHAAKQEEASE